MALLITFQLLTWWKKLSMQAFAPLILSLYDRWKKHPERYVVGAHSQGWICEKSGTLCGA